MKKWAIIEVETTFIPGDERSRTHPGHGYPASTVSHTVYREYDNWDKFVNEVKRKTARKDNFRAVEVTPVEIKTEVVVRVE